MNKYPTKMSFDLIESKLDEIEKIIKKTGEIKAVEKYLKISSPTLRQYRKKLPKLEIEIQKSLNTYKDRKFNKFTKEKLQILYSLYMLS